MTLTTARATSRRRRRARAGSLRLELILLLVAPALGVVVTGTWPMSVGLQTRWTMIDPTLYTAYLEHGTDLMARFGGNDYYWVRQGFLLPAHVAYVLFGPVGGFVVFRYVLALIVLVPGFLLLHRHFSRATAWCFVAAVVTSPVVLMTWGSDYPDSAALSYLMAGTTLALFPAHRTTQLAALRLGAGLLLGLALNAHAASLPIIAVVVLASGLAHPRADVAGRWRQAAVVLGGIVLATGVLAGLAGVLWGDADIVSPTVRQFLRLRRPDQVAIWHSSTWAWADRATYLLVPLALAAAVAVSARHRSPRDTREAVTAGLAVAGAGSVVAAALVQADGGFFLEYYFYSSLLWWSVPFLIAILLGTIVAGRPAWARWAPALAVPAVAVVAAVLPGPVARFAVVPVGVILAVAVVVLARLVRGRTAPVTVTGVAVIVVAVWMLTVGQPVTTYARGQATYPLVDYGAVSHADVSRIRDVYRVVSDVPALVPPATHPGERVLVWPAPHEFPGPPMDPVGQAAAQYLTSRLSSTMPRLSPSDDQQLQRADAGSLVLLLSNTGNEFDAAEAALARWDPRRLSRTTLSSGSVVLHAEVVRLAPSP